MGITWTMTKSSCISLSARGNHLIQNDFYQAYILSTAYGE